MMIELTQEQLEAVAGGSAPLAGHLDMVTILKSASQQKQTGGIRTLPGSDNPTTTPATGTK